jgi:hypothetical protein
MLFVSKFQRSPRSREFSTKKLTSHQKRKFSFVSQLEKETLQKKIGYANLFHIAKIAEVNKSL